MRWFRFTWSGLVGALVAFAVALTPSLLPRPWLYMGAIAGLAAAVGYGVGVLLAWAVRRLLPRPPSDRSRRVAWRVLAVAGPLLLVVAIVAGGRWQNQVRELVGETPEHVGHFLGITLVAAALGLLGIAVGLAVRGAWRWTARGLGRLMPVPVAQTIAVVVVALLGYWLVTGVAFRAFTSAADSVYAGNNAGTPSDAVEPTSDLRSGGPGSAVPWDSLGYQGRGFVGRGPTAADIEAFAGRPAKEPIRVYVGLDTATTAQERAALAVDELQRTGAFDRAVLVVAGATGTGWLEPQAVDSLEYLWGGDTAIATIQYSYLPSWISFLTDKERAADAGQALFEAVRTAWLELPPDHRPQLVSYGLSLGSFAAQSAFATAADVADRTDGALYVGTPNFAEPWRSIEDGRDAGSPEWQPVYGAGEVVRFAAQASDFARPAGPWNRPRVAYLQHASDPVVWWSPDLLLRRPDWLAEPRGPDVSAEMTWFPVVTFLQVTVDQFFGVSVPDGHGHNYAGTMVAAWQQVVPADGWSAADLARLQALIDGYPVE